jgi:hypothetical protein
MLIAGQHKLKYKAILLPDYIKCDKTVGLFLYAIFPDLFFAAWYSHIQ